MTSTTPDPVTQALTGVWPFILIVGALLTFPVSAVLLWLYRRAVLRGMKKSRDADVPIADTVTTPDAVLKLLQFVSLEPPAAGCGTLRGPSGAGVVYVAGGAAYAAVMATAWFFATHDQQIGPIKSFFLFWGFCWATV